MSKEGEVAVAGQRRKSARILALEEEKKEKQRRNLSAIANNNNISNAGLSGNGSFGCQQQLHHGLALSSTTMAPTPPLKRGRKQKRLEDLVLSSLAQNSFQEGGENTKDGNTLTRHDQQANGLPSIQWIPEKRILELVLDILQRRDTHKIFAQPVNPKEVETYYTIIKEPMDFGTMRTKLQEGKYTSLEKFEHDVFLISSNAMHFNSSATIYYKEARGMQEVAQMVFRALRTDPYKLESQLISLTRSGHPGRRPLITEVRGPRSRLPRLGVKIGASPLGPRYGGNSSSLTKRGTPPINRPWIPFCSEYESLISSVYSAHKTLVQNDDNEDFGYKKSLLLFVKNLGPTARKVAARKLIQCLPNYLAPGSSRRTPFFYSQQITQRFLLPSPRPSPHNFQTSNTASLVPYFPGNSNDVPSNGKVHTFNLNIQASPVEQGYLASSYGGIKICEPVADGGLKMNNLIMPPPKEKNPIDQDKIRKMPFVLDKNIAENRGRDTRFLLKGKSVAAASGFNEKMGIFPGNFLRENIAGQWENKNQMPFLLDNNVAAYSGRDTRYSFEGKMVAETSDFNERTRIFSRNFRRENVAGQQENTNQMSFILDNFAANRGRDAQYPLMGKTVAPKNDFNERIGDFPGNFLQDSVAGQRKNNTPMPFIWGNKTAANGGRDTRYPSKGKMVAETTDFNEKMGSFPGNVLWEGLAGQRENNCQMPFILDCNIAAKTGRDTILPLKGKMVAEISDFNEKMRNYNVNFLRENVAGQRENNSQMPFILDGNIAANPGRDTILPLKGKMLAETSDLNEKKGNFPGSFLRENAAGQNKFWLASHFRVIPVNDDDPNTPPGSSKTRFRTVDMLAEGNNSNNIINNNLQKGKQVEVVHQPPLDRVDQLSANWKSRLQDFVRRSNDYLVMDTTFLSPSPEFPSSTDPTAATIRTVLGLLDGSNGPVGCQGPVTDPNCAGNYTGLFEGGNVLPSYEMLLSNEANSLNQLTYTPLRQDLPPASSAVQLGKLMPLHNEPTNVLQERVADLNQDELSLEDTQLPDLALQL
ncbi:Histone acetylase PCAF [Trema orientale]|uniref:Histone acetylase PCAF n=1 Tax=Trema orientale TaxID=63057 RepID=A0A2P5DRE4_TREOI|nr:Histone acetylase PCAF [Trema orientale]